MSSAMEILNDYQSNTVIHHLDNFTALKIMAMAKSNFITNFTYKVYKNTLTGGH